MLCRFTSYHAEAGEENETTCSPLLFVTVTDYVFSKRQEDEES